MKVKVIKPLVADRVIIPGSSIELPEDVARYHEAAGNVKIIEEVEVPKAIFEAEEQPTEQPTQRRGRPKK